MCPNVTRPLQQVLQVPRGATPRDKRQPQLRVGRALQQTHVTRISNLHAHAMETPPDYILPTTCGAVRCGAGAVLAEEMPRHTKQIQNHGADATEDTMRVVSAHKKLTVRPSKTANTNPSCTASPCGGRWRRLPSARRGRRSLPPSLRLCS